MENKTDFKQIHVKGFARTLVESYLPKAEKSLGYTRDQLPQFNNQEELDSFIQLCKDCGTRVIEKTMLVRDLIPSQAGLDLDFSKVVDIVQDYTQKSPVVTTPIAVDRDGYIIDGHHRWTALMYINPNMEVPVVQFNNKIRSIVSNKVPRWQDTMGTATRPAE